MMALMTRVRNVDATDADQLAAAEREGRRQAHEYFRFLRENVPGYERAALVSTSPAIGVRESRRILGEHVLTADEILAATRFPDQIARCGAPIEEHHAGDDTRWVYLAEGATYGIPFRSLQPRGARERARRRPLLLGDARRARLGAVDGDVHGDGPGGRHRRGAGGRAEAARSRGRFARGCARTGPMSAIERDSRGAPRRDPPAHGRRRRAGRAPRRGRRRVSSRSRSTATTRSARSSARARAAT